MTESIWNHRGHIHLGKIELTVGYPTRKHERSMSALQLQKTTEGYEEVWFKLDRQGGKTVVSDGDGSDSAREVIHDRMLLYIA